MSYNDNLKTTLYEEIITRLGGTVDDLPDRLETTYLKRIIECLGGGSGDSGDSGDSGGTTVTFTIFNTIFVDYTQTVPEGMTWGEWAETTYRDELEDYEFFVKPSDKSIIHVEDGYIVDAQGNRVHADTVIVEGAYSRVS